MIIGGAQADVTVSEYFRVDGTYVLRVPHSTSSLWNSSATVAGRVVSDRLRLREGLASGVLAAALKEAVLLFAQETSAVREGLQSALENTVKDLRFLMDVTVAQESAPIKRDQADMKTALALHMESIRALEVAHKMYQENLDALRSRIDLGLRETGDAYNATYRSQSSHVNELAAAVTTLTGDVKSLREDIRLLASAAETDSPSQTDLPTSRTPEDNWNQRIEAALLVQAGHERDITQIQSQLLQLGDQLSTIESRLADVSLEFARQNEGLMERVAKSQADLCSVAHRFNTTYLAPQAPVTAEGLCLDAADRRPELVGVWHGCPPDGDSRLTFSGEDLSGVGTWSDGAKVINFAWRTDGSVTFSYANAQETLVEVPVRVKTFSIHPAHRKTRGQFYEAARLEVTGAWWTEPTHFVRWHLAKRLT